MTPAEREEFYDAEIAPALASLAARCHENGMAFVALVDWSPEDVGLTIQLVERSSPQARWARFAALCRGNVDTLIMTIMNEARVSGHSSLCLRLLGISEKPEQVTEST